MKIINNAEQIESPLRVANESHHCEENPNDIWAGQLSSYPLSVKLKVSRMGNFESCSHGTI